MLSIIPLPEGFVEDITANLGTIIADLAPYITLIIGVLLGCAVISILVGIFWHR